MTSLISLSTDTWVVTLPQDWSEQGQVEGGTLYFESADGTCGLYIATWRVADGVSATAALAQFRHSGLQTLREMDGYDWAIKGDETQAGEDGTLVSSTDCLAAAKQYRILGKILVRAPIVVRAAFHHYLCEDYEASRQAFAPIVASLRFRHEA